MWRPLQSLGFWGTGAEGVGFDGFVLEEPWAESPTGIPAKSRKLKRALVLMRCTRFKMVSL